MRLQLRYPALLAPLLFVLSIPPIDGGETPSNPGSGAKGHTPVVQELVRSVENEDVLREQLALALKDRDPKSFWYGKSLDDLYVLFDQWLRFLPRPDNARLYMDRFEDFATTANGKTAVLNSLFRLWLTTFMYAQGDFMDSRDSSKIVPKWTGSPDIDMEDYIVPCAGYTSFNDFFTRRIKPWKRPIHAPFDASVLTSPADSYVLPIAESIASETEFNVKGDSLNIEELLGKTPLAKRFIGGTASLCMLDTVDYHRFHSPVAGQILSANQLAGLYYGMDGEWVENFYQHRRGYFIFDTWKYGLVGMVPVGMFTISSIYFKAAAGDVVDKGAELGNFAYGGSAIILLFEAGRVTIETPPMTHVKMGERIGTLHRPGP